MRVIIRSGLVAVAGTVLLTGCHGGSRQDAAPATATTATAPASDTPAPATTTPAAAQPADQPATTRTINGKLFYVAKDSTARTHSRLYRLDGSRLRTVLSGSGILNVEASPDGRHLAYILSNGDLMVSGADGSAPRKLRSNAVTAGFGPTWSGDGTRVVTAVNIGAQRWQAGTVRISDGRYAALPRAIQDNIHYRLTGDGTRYFYSDGRCSILSARTDGTRIRKVPGLGLDATGAANPRRLRACDIVSLNRDGSRMTVDLHVGNDTDGDIGGSRSADAVVDTATGKVVALPVRGTVRQALFLNDGTLLVRSGSAGRPVLTLLSSTLAVLATRTEPASVRDFVLVDYTR
jgi:TolB protein